MNSSTKKMISALTAAFVISEPQVELTESRLTSCWSMPAFVASAKRTAFCFSWVCADTSTRMLFPDGALSVWTFAWAGLSPLSLRTVRAESSVSPLLAGAVQATPPLKSSPRFSPRVNSDTSVTRINRPETRKPILRLPTKSNVVSPW